MFVGVALFFGRESVLWAFYKFLDFFTTEEGSVTLAAVPWQDVMALILGIAGLGLIFWPSNKQAKPNPYTTLWVRADNIVGRIRQQRNRGRWLRVVGGEPLTDVIRDGISTLMMFGQQGFVTPRFDSHQAERIAVGLEHYFATMIPLLRDGHIATALSLSAETSTVAEDACQRFNIANWSDDPYAGF